MIYEEANSVKELAPDNYEVLKKLDVECPVCGGIDIRNKAIESCSCGDIGRVKWEWTPQPGEWCIVRDDVRLITEKDCIGTKDIGFAGYNDDMNVVNLTNIIPILEWETIENVLEKVGYDLIVDNLSCNLYEIFPNQKRTGYFISPDNPKVSTNGKSRQEAVMKAVIELGNELKK